ncbi:MAG: transcriptional regulator [Actinomycetota bacterium]|nr:transcriptional regulator [Actinomycetota bacterium]
MAQVTWRAPDELVDRVRTAAAAQHHSVNEYLTRLAQAATDPDLAGDDAARTRERLARAGLLVPAGPPRPRPDPEAVAAARAAAGRGTPLSELVTESRG